MKGFLLLGMFFLFADANGQLWKEYADSAKVYRDQKNIKRSLEFLYKSNVELKKDSLQTLTHARNSYNLALTLYNLGQFEKAEGYFIEAKDIWEKKLGKESLNYAAGCNGLAYLYEKMEELEKAEKYYLETLQVKEKISGKENRDYALSCNNLGLFYYNTGEFEKAEKYWVEGRLLRGKVLGKQHTDYTNSCSNLAILYQAMGKYSLAEPLCIEAREILGTLVGKENTDYANACNALAILYHLMGQFEKAEDLYIEAQNLREKLFGKMSEDYGSSVNNLGVFYIDNGLYDKGAMFYQQALEIREKVLGKEHIEYIGTCNNLATYYFLSGQFEKAELLYKEALYLTEKIEGKKNPDFAGYLSNLAIFYQDIGQYEKAKTLFIDALAIREKIVGKEHPDYAASCSNLGSLYLDMKQYNEAEQMLRIALDVYEKALGKEHPDYANCLSNLAVFYEETGNYAMAEKSYLEVLQILEKTVGKEHPDYALGCRNLALSYIEAGRYDAAESYFNHSLQIREKILGTEHPGFTEVCKDLANLYRIKHLDEKSFLFFQRSIQGNDLFIKRFFSFTSEKEKQTYVNKIAPLRNSFNSFLLENKYPAALGFGYDISLLSRFMVLSSTQQLRSHVYSSNDTSLAIKYNKWIETKEQLAFLLSKPVSERNGRDSILTIRADNIEKELNRLVSSFKEKTISSNISWKEVQKNLKEGEAAIEFTDFNYLGNKKWTDSTCYMAFVLRKDKPEPELIYLFEKKQLDSALNIKVNNYSERIDLLYSSSDLYNLIWRPLESELIGIKTIYFATSGQLHLLNISALSAGNNQTIGDKYRLTQMNTTASVINRDNDIINSTDKILLYGGIKYSTDSVSLMDAAQKYAANDYVTRSIPIRFGGPDEIPELFYSEIEVDSIDHYAKRNGYSTTVLRGVYANEESFKALNGKNSPAVLHLATHGFFNPDPIKIKEKGSLAGGKAFALSDDPLMRSGMLLAGANNVWSGKPIKGIEDGVLTGYEVSNMYLPNTKLVVLSACETGLGQVLGSEGVYGLQRAFKIAGVENLVMSLWRVPDNATAEFMQLFYKQLLDKSSVTDAFYIAQSVMRDKYRTTPYKWAGLILVK